MLHALFDIHIPVSLALIGAFALAGHGLVRSSGFFRALIERRLADPRHESHLEGLRGVLAFGVLIHHAAYTWQNLQLGGWYAHEPDSHFLRLLGGASVSLFFFLTGYLFWSGFLKQGAEPFSWRRFYRRRLLRIAPAYWLFCAVMLLVVLLDAGGSLRTTVAELAWSLARWLVFGVPLGHFPDVNGFEQTRLINADVAWSLRHEVLFYLLLPFLRPWARLRGTLWLVLVFALALAGSKLLDRLAFPVQGAQGLWLRAVLQDGLIEFSKFLLFGFAPGMLTAWALQRPLCQRLLGRVTQRQGVLAVLACLLFLLLNADPRFAFLKVLPLWVIFLLVVARKVPTGLLRAPGLVLMGLASYSVYLFHGVFLFLLEPRGLDLYQALGRPGAAGYWLLIAGVGLVTLVTAALVYRFVEHPCLQWGGRVAGPPVSS